MWSAIKICADIVLFFVVFNIVVDLAVECLLSDRQNVDDVVVMCDVMCGCENVL